jgi:hypothetical protein
MADNRADFVHELQGFNANCTQSGAGADYKSQPKLHRKGELSNQTLQSVK